MPSTSTLAKLRTQSRVQSAPSSVWPRAEGRFDQRLTERKARMGHLACKKRPVSVCVCVCVFDGYRVWDPQTRGLVKKSAVSKPGFTSFTTVHPANWS